MDKPTLAPELVTPGERNFTFPVEGKEDGQGYLSVHNRDAKHAVILIQEWWGLNKSIEQTSDRFA